MENRLGYNSPQNRSTIRDPRYMIVELKHFISVVLNALRRCPERHELWLQFAIGIIPYADRALATFVIHVVEQICRNIYACIRSTGFESEAHSAADVSPREYQQRGAFCFVDFRLPKSNFFNPLSSAFERPQPPTNPTANYVTTVCNQTFRPSRFWIFSVA